MLGACISLLALYLILSEVNLGAVVASLGHVSLTFLALGLCSVIINTLAKAARWHLLLGPSGKNVGYIKILSALIAGQMINALLPLRMGDLSRAYDIGGQGPGRAFTLGSVVIEKAIDLLCLALLIVLLLLLLPLPVWLTRTVIVTTVVAFLLAISLIVLVNRVEGVAALFNRLLGLLPARLNVMVIQRLDAALLSLKVLRSHVVLIQLTAWSLLIWSTALLTNEFILLAFNIQLPISAATLLLVVLMAGVSIPNVGGSIGIFEYMCVVSLGLFGVDTALAFSYGIVLHAITLLPMILVGPIYLLGLRKLRIYAIL